MELRSFTHRSYPGYLASHLFLAIFFLLLALFLSTVAVTAAATAAVIVTVPLLVLAHRESRQKAESRQVKPN
jgi:predicted membrane protein